MARSRRGDMSFYEAVGRRIRDARHGKITQAALASLVSLTRTSIVNIEQGRQQLLLHTLVDIARALQVPSSDLIPPVSDPNQSDLPTVLKGQSKKAQNWVTSTVKSVRKES